MSDKITRLYGDSIDINKDKVRLFWNDRSNKYTEDNPYKVVKCSDSNKEYINISDEYEKEIILPKLDINNNSKVLDIGCGIGRLAEVVIPHSNYYLGTDFAESLLTIANERVFLVGDYDFRLFDFKETVKSEYVKNKGPFNKVILAGVAMYINDKELEFCINNLLGILDKRATIYLSSSIAIEKRLTLKEFYSNDLNSKYSVVYRTIEDYISIFEVLINNGFKIKESENFLENKRQYSETARHYFILERE